MVVMIRHCEAWLTAVAEIELVDELVVVATMRTHTFQTISNEIRPILCCLVSLNWSIGYVVSLLSEFVAMASDEQAVAGLDVDMAQIAVAAEDEMVDSNCYNKLALVG